jgi:hypothetical protein
MIDSTRCDRENSRSASFRLITIFVPRERIVSGFDVVRVHPIRAPDPARLLGLVRAGKDSHFGADHEGGIKADSELTDEARIAGVFLDLLEKRFRSGVRNGPKILDQLVAGHPDAGIRNLTHEMCLIRRTRYPVKNTETLNSQLSTIPHP